MRKTKTNITFFTKAILTIAMSVLFSFIITNQVTAKEISTKEEIIYNSSSYSESYTLASFKKNDVCNVKEMKEKYQESCYSCIVVKTLTETFMNACSKAYPMSRDAGTKLAILGSIIWLVVFALKNVSSFTSLEPSNNVNDLLVFIFKVLGAIVFINIGIPSLVSYFIEPILMAGADYGKGIIAAVAGVTEEPTAEYAFNGEEVISKEAINSLFGLNMAIDKVVSENLVLGNALVCHANNAGALVDVSALGVSIKIPDFWILLCGAAIWCMGFMLTLSISFYVLDVCFKLGFAIIALPVAIGLWPFEMTKGKVGAVLSIVFKSAAIFAFLAITTSYSLVLISNAVRDLGEFYKRIENDDATWISDTFEITGPYFLIIIFAYLYSLKMIGGSIKNYVDKFFPDAAFGSASPIHNKATQATDIVKQKSVAIGKGAAKIGGRMAAAGVKTGAKKIGKGISNGISSLREEGGSSLAGNMRKATGRAILSASKKVGNVGDFGRNIGKKLQNFSDKQIQKGANKNNIFRLAAGGLAGKMAHATMKASNITNFSKGMRTAGLKLEKEGKQINQAYRDGIRKDFVEAVDKTTSAVKGVALRGKTFVKDKANAAGTAVKNAAVATGEAIQDTKVYKAGEKVVVATANTAVKTGKGLAKGYNIAKTGTKGAVLRSKVYTKKKANQVGNFAKRTAKRTWVYKAGKFTAKVTDKAYGITKKKVRNAQQKVTQVSRHVKVGTQQVASAVGSAVVNSAPVQVVKMTGQGINHLYKATDQGLSDGYTNVRSFVGERVGAKLASFRAFRRGISNAVKGRVKRILTTTDNFRKATGQATNKFIYKGLGGEKLAQVLEKNINTVNEDKFNPKNDDNGNENVKEETARNERRNNTIKGMREELLKALKDAKVDKKEQKRIYRQKALEFETLARNSTNEIDKNMYLYEARRMKSLADGIF